ncbi:MAG: response regulator [Lachnospiraceae bacterium]|nr:response regulator [Lachnospiraceae bacterium]
MSDKTGIMVIGGKESFLIRTLLKKLTDAGFDAFFCQPSIDAVSALLGRAELTVYYMDADEKPNAVFLHYLQDQLLETCKGLMLIGEKTDMAVFATHFSNGVILERFERPLQTDAFIAAVQKYAGDGFSAKSRKHILIVDDDPTYMGVIRDWLRSTYKVSMANSGLQAIKWLGSNTADLILLDFEMPVTSGPQVLEMLRSEHETAHIPVFFLTGKNDRESVLQVVGLKPENYLLKTIEREKLLQTLDSFFKGH